jgi:predicted nucleotidyltransferase
LEKEIIAKKIKDVRDFIISKGFDPCFTFVHGSQNYQLEDELSDLDAYCFIFPSLSDLYNKVEVATTIETPYGQATIKDIRSFPYLIKKANPSMIEILFTEYYLCHPIYEEIKKLNRDLYNEKKDNYLISLYYTAMAKYHAVTKLTPKTAPILEKFGGYNPKELHHLIRNTLMLEMLLKGKDILDVIIFKNQETRKYLLEIKRNGCGDLENATHMSEYYQKQLELQFEKLPKIDTSKEDVFIKKIEDIIKGMTLSKIKASFY